MWKHLERLGGGVGTRGPGETQLETDRRHRAPPRHAAQARPRRTSTSSARRAARSAQRAETPTVALAGYTNVGKSTLLNALTGADVSVDNRLFETLDPTTRAFELDGPPLPRHRHRRLHPPPAARSSSRASRRRSRRRSSPTSSCTSSTRPRRRSGSTSSSRAVEAVLHEIGADELPRRARPEQDRRASTRWPAPAREPLPGRAPGVGADRRGSRRAAGADRRRGSPSGSRPCGCCSRTSEGGKLAELYALGAPIDERERHEEGVLVRARLPRREIRALRARTSSPTRRRRRSARGDRAARSGGCATTRCCPRARTPATRASTSPPASGSSSAPGERAVVRTGLAVAIPEGYAGFVQPRSGLAARHGITIVNAPGLDRLRLPRRAAGRAPEHRPRASRSSSSRACGSRSSSCSRPGGRAGRGRRAAGERARRPRVRLVRAALMAPRAADPGLGDAALATAGSCSAGTRSTGKEHWLLPGGGVNGGEASSTRCAASSRRRSASTTSSRRGAGRARRLDLAAAQRCARSTSCTSSSPPTSAAGRSRRSPRRTPPSAATGCSTLEELDDVVVHPPIQRFLRRWRPATRRCISARSGSLDASRLQRRRPPRVPDAPRAPRPRAPRPRARPGAARAPAARLPTRGRAPARAASRRATGSAAAAGRAGTCRHAAGAAALVAALAVVAEAGDDAAERLGAGVEQRAARVVLEAGQRPPLARLQLALEQDVADHPPRPGDRVEREERRRPGSSVAATSRYDAPEQLVAAADGEHRRAARDRLAQRRRPSPRGRARRAPARDPGRRRRRRGRARPARTASPSPIARTSSSWPRHAARRASTAMLPRSA